MESFSTVIVIFGIFATLCQIAALTFIILDKDGKTDFKWVWCLLLLVLGPIILIPYWFWGREK